MIDLKGVFGMDAIRTNALTLGYGEEDIIEELDLVIPKGKSLYSSEGMVLGNRHCFVHWHAC